MNHGHEHSNYSRAERKDNECATTHQTTRKRASQRFKNTIPWTTKRNDHKRYDHRAHIEHSSLYQAMKPITNKDARGNYTILETLEAGIKLLGYETKSVRAGRVSFKGAFVTVSENEAWIKHLTIQKYQPKNIPESYDPERPRKLLLTSREQKRLIGKLREKSMTVIPTKIYAGKHDRIKVEIAVARGKTKQDKRQEIKKREADREIARAMRGKI